MIQITHMKTKLTLFRRNGIYYTNSLNQSEQKLAVS